MSVFQQRSIRATSVAFINAVTLKTSPLPPSSTMKASDADETIAKKQPAKPMEWSHYQILFLAEMCSESRRRFFSTPEYKELKEKLKGRPVSELLRARIKLRDELNAERKFDEFDAEAIKVIHERVKVRLYEEFINLPPGVHRMKHGIMIVGGNRQRSDEEANPP